MYCFFALLDGIPTKYYYGTMENTKFGKLFVLVMQLLGKSLSQLQENNGGKFSEKTVYMIAIQLVSPLTAAVNFQS